MLHFISKDEGIFLYSNKIFMTRLILILLVGMRTTLLIHDREVTLGTITMSFVLLKIPEDRINIL